MSDRKKIFLIDGMNMAYRNFFALGQANLTTSSGQAVSCVLGTALFMNRLFREEKPDYIAVLMDTAEPTFRHEQYEDYKGNREEMPDDLSSQLPFFVELLECYGCAVLSQAGYEADDLIGTLVKKLSKKNCDIYIVSGDKDFMLVRVGRHAIRNMNLQAVCHLITSNKRPLDLAFTAIDRKR